MFKNYKEQLKIKKEYQKIIELRYVLMALLVII